MMYKITVAMINHKSRQTHITPVYTGQHPDRATQFVNSYFEPEIKNGFKVTISNVQDEFGNFYTFK